MKTTDRFLLIDQAMYHLNRNELSKAAEFFRSAGDTFFAALCEKRVRK